MRRTLLILIPVVLILALFFILRNCASAVIERDSDDGRLHLSIPAAALPAGTDANSIRIVTLDAATVAAVPGVLRPLFAYRLEPEGLSFSIPVELEFDPTVYGPGQLPLLLHRSGTGLEALPLEVGVTGGRVDSITARLSHFSHVVGALSILGLNIGDPGDQHMDAPFYVTADIYGRQAEIDRIDGNPAGVWSRRQAQGPLHLRAGAFKATGTLTPTDIADKPATADKTLDGDTQVELFECTAESTGNQISYTVSAAYKLSLSNSIAPNPVEVPVNDTITVRTEPFACQAAQPADDYFRSSRLYIDGTAEDYFASEITKTPGGRISVGKDFTLKAEVSHVYDGAGTTAIGPWDLRYGLFEYNSIVTNAISPVRVDDQPWLAVVSPQESWRGKASFRCMNAGSATINYKAFIYVKAPDANINGVLAVPVNAQAAVDCIADANALPAGSFTALSGSDRIGISSHVAAGATGFQARWWREPAADDIVIGTPVKVHVEVENLRMPATGSPGAWTLSGKLYTMAGNGLEPREYPQAPPPGVSLPFRGVWSADFNFICRNAGIASLHHSFTLLPPTSPTDPPLQLSVDDPGLRCVGD